MNDKKIKIFNAVLDEIREQGIPVQITIADIAKKANIGKGTVYEYFESKDQIIAETILYLIDISTREITKPIDESLSFEEALVYFHKNIFRVLNDNNGVYSLFISKNIMSIANDEVRNLLKNSFETKQCIFKDFFVQLIKRGVNEGVISIYDDQFHLELVRKIIFMTTMDMTLGHKKHFDMPDEEIFIKTKDAVIKILK